MLTISEEAGKIGAEHASPRVCNAIYSALNVINDAPMLQVAVSTIEANGRRCDNRCTHLDLSWHHGRLRHCHGANKAERRAQQQGILPYWLVTHTGDDDGDVGCCFPRVWMDYLLFVVVVVMTVEHDWDGPVA